GFLARAYVDAHGGDAGVALAAVLDAFKRYALAAAVLTRGAERFETPLPARPPFAIPSTRLVLVAPDAAGESASITGASADGLDVTFRDQRRLVPFAHDRNDGAPIQIEPCAVATHGDVDLPLNPAALDLP